MSVLLETSLGDIVIDLFWEKAPLACKNFIKLCKAKYYNGALFFDVQKDYLTRIMHEKKPPTSLNHMLYGEQAKYFEDQMDPEAKHSTMGTVSTANVGPNMNDSNFFMTLSNSNIESLNGKHTIFGVVAEGVEVLQKVNEAYVDEQNRPYKNIRILHTPVLDDPFDDPPELEIPENSPEINYDETDRLDVNDQLDLLEGHGRTEEEVIEETKRHEAKTKAIVLEMLNDLPDADIKPPDNVLFVCKLNPVTQEDDLETIFSQFGPIKSCEVIRDWKTGASLQYAFIEFETAAACEEAFFKMENALIDERRIHVDFSQSVAKYWYKYKSGNPIAFNKGDGGQGKGRGGPRPQPRLELKTQHRQEKGGYSIVIDEKEARRESRKHRDSDQRRRESPRREQVRKPRSQSRSRNRSTSKEKRRERREKEEVRYRRRDSRSPRRKEVDKSREKARNEYADKRERGSQKRRDDSNDRYKTRDREREREKEKGRVKDKKRDDHKGRRSNERRRRRSSSSRSSRSSSSSSSASSSRSSS